MCRTPRTRWRGVSWTEDHAEIAELAYRYAACADDRDWAGAAALFTTDGILVRADPPDHLLPTVRHDGRREIEEAIRLLIDVPLTFHAVVGVIIDVGPGADEARGRVACMAHHVTERADQPTAVVWHMHYLDEYRRTGESWQIARRDLFVDFVEARPVKVARLQSDPAVEVVRRLADGL